MNKNNALTYEGAWKELTCFIGDDEFLFEHKIDATKPLATLTPKFNIFVLELIAEFERKENQVPPELLAQTLVALCRIIPFSQQLRLYVGRFCELFPEAAVDELKAMSGRAARLGTVDYRIPLAELLAEIENQNVELLQTATYGGIAVWPMMRAALATQVENKILARGRLEAHIAHDKQTAIAEIRNTFSNGIRYSAPDIQFIEDDAAYRNRTLEVEFLFYSRSQRYLRKRNGNWVAGPLDSLHQLLAGRYACLKIEEYDEHTLKRQPRALPPKYFRTPWGHSKRRFLQKMNPFMSAWAGMEERDSWTLYTRASEALGLKGDSKTYRGLMNNLKYASGYANFFRDFLQNTNPSFVFQEFYFSPESVGLTLACKSLNLPVIEVQHGLIGSHQWLSTHWLQMPLDGYCSHPDYFLVFDQFEKENSEAFLPDQASPRPSIACGLVELERHRRKGKHETPQLKQSERDFEHELKDGKYNLLYSMQYDNTDFSPIVAMSKFLPADTRILIRLHPMQRPLIDDVVEIIEEFGLKNVEVEKPTKLPLYNLMAQCHHVVTRYSTLAREALEFDCNVTLVGEVGKQLFHQYIELGRMSFSLSNEDLVRVVLSEYNQHKDGPTRQNKLAEFEAFRRTYLSANPENAVETLRKDWNKKADHRQQTAQKLLTTSLMSTPLDISRCLPNDISPRVERSRGDYRSRIMYVVQHEVPINRQTLTALFRHTVLDTNPRTAVDLLFQGESAAANSMEILQLFYGMSKRSVNVHIDALASDVAVYQSNAVQVTYHYLDKLRTDAALLREPCSTTISASADARHHTKQWLAANNLVGDLTVLTFGGDLTHAEVVALLNSTRVSEVAASCPLIVNGSRHFVDGDINAVPHGVLFEPAAHALDAAVALCQTATVNLLVSKFDSERLYTDAGRSSVRLSPDQWQDTAINNSDLLHSPTNHATNFRKSK